MWYGWANDENHPGCSQHVSASDTLWSNALSSRGEEDESKEGKRASGKNWHPHSVSLALLRWGGGAFSLLSVVLDYNTAKNSRKDLDFPQKTWISVPTASLTV